MTCSPVMGLRTRIVSPLIPAAQLATTAILAGVAVSSSEPLPTRDEPAASSVPSSSAPPAADEDINEHTEADPATPDPEILAGDACAQDAQMCGEIGSVGDCEDDAMCGTVTPTDDCSDAEMCGEVDEAECTDVAMCGEIIPGPVEGES